MRKLELTQKQGELFSLVMNSNGSSTSLEFIKADYLSGRVSFSAPIHTVYKNYTDIFCKAFALSEDGETLFTAGLTMKRGSGMLGYVSVHNVALKNIREIDFRVSSDSSHSLKKGFYRVSLLPKKAAASFNCQEIILAGAWLDLYIYSFDSLKLEKVYAFRELHTGT